jgi:hypothetical protein
VLTRNVGQRRNTYTLAASHPYVSISLEFTNLIFYFVGFIALAVFMSTLVFCRGMVCAVARADIAFAATEFVLWVVTAVLMGKDVFKAGFSLRGGRQPASVLQMKQAGLP